MKALVILSVGLSLTACTGATGSGLDGYSVNYDNLRQVQADCAAKGGTLTLRPNGDNQNMADYACRKD